MLMFDVLTWDKLAAWFCVIFKSNKEVKPTSLQSESAWTFQGSNLWCRLKVWCTEDLKYWRWSHFDVSKATQKKLYCLCASNMSGWNKVGLIVLPGYQWETASLWPLACGHTILAQMDLLDMIYALYVKTRMWVDQKAVYILQHDQTCISVMWFSSLYFRMYWGFLCVCVAWLENCALREVHCSGDK